MRPAARAAAWAAALGAVAAAGMLAPLPGLHAARIGSRPRDSGAPASVGAPVRAGAPVPAVQPAPEVDLAGLRWSDFHGIELPSSPIAGPRRADGLASGFTDSPLGALLAAVNITVRANAQWGPRIFGPTIRRQVTGPDAAALLAGCQSGYKQESRAAHVTGGGPLGTVRVSIEAFRMAVYAPDSAVIDLVSAGPGVGGVTVTAVTRVETAWDGRDWQVIAPPGGTWASAATRLSSPAGYTVFGGQG